MTAPAHPLADLLAGVALTPDHEKVIAVLEETGYGPAAVSLLRTYAAHLAPADRVRGAHFEFHCTRPAGIDPRASEGLPSCMTVGTDAEGTWWHCSTHYWTHRSGVDMACELRDAEDHATTYHRAAGGGRRG